mmetsp:Transcript_20543/g.61253  ORF Transcript_20543/g.61253 Transcript_20543/m.61253 type:complete len:93 (+) Transcript_20543:226-504(+)
MLPAFVVSVPSAGTGARMEGQRLIFSAFLRLPHPRSHASVHAHAYMHAGQQAQARASSVARWHDGTDQAAWHVTRGPKRQLGRLGPTCCVCD